MPVPRFNIKDHGKSLSTDKEVIFARLYGVYTLRSKDQGEESISGRVLDLEYARAERNRGELSKDLISQGLNP